MVALIVGYVLALVPGLTRWPPLINDEGREANLFWVASGADPTAERMNAHRGFPTWGTGGLQGATAAAIFRLADVGVFQARLTSLLWGGLLLGAVYWLGTLYWNRAVGLAAIALLAVSDPFLVSTHTLRPDIQVVTLVVASLALAETAVASRESRVASRKGARGWSRFLMSFRAREESTDGHSVDSSRARNDIQGGPWVLALLAGLLVGLAVDTHLNSLGFIPFVALVFPLRQGWGFWRRREVWLFGTGLAGAAAYYLGVRVLPDPAGFLAAMGYWLGVDKAPPAVRGGSDLAGMVGNELARYWDYFGEEPLELGLVLAGLVGGLWWAVRGSQPARLILLGLAAAFLFFVVAVSMKSKYYMLLTYPFYMLLVGRLLERVAAWLGWLADRDVTSPHPPPSPRGRGGFSAPWSRVVTPVALAALVGLAMYFPLRAEERAWDNYVWARRYREGQEYAALTARLGEMAGPEARILAPPLYWIGLHEHPFVDIYVYERLERQYGMSVAQFLDETRPELVITDGNIATDKRVERLIFRELDARATRELVGRHKNFGDVAVYRLRY